MREQLFRWSRRLSALALLLSCIATQGLTAQVRQLNRDRSQPIAASERRIALVIGNGAYTNAPPLKNPPNDARDMAATLKELGFDVTSGINVNQREMKTLIREFGQKLKAGGSGLFYYAGHGVQSKGHNYLIPIEADIQSEAEVEDTGVDVNLVLNYMDDAQNELNIVILDACRNNPFARSFRSATNGLAQVDAPTGTLIAYATAPGRVASDGTGQNGLYTSELLKQMRVPGLSATDMFMHVRAEVMKQTSNKQVPWEASSLVGAFYFNASSTNASLSNSGNAAQPAAIDAVAVEREYWETIRTSNEAQDYKEFLIAHPNGAYAGVARAKLRQLATPKSTQTTAAQPTNTALNAIGNPPNESTGSSIVKDPTGSPYELGQAALQRNDLDSAVTWLDRATTTDPKLASAWTLLVGAYLRRAAVATNEAKANADYRSAVRAGEGLMKVRPDEDATILLAQALIGAQQYARAAETLERVTTGRNPKEVALYLLGVASSRIRNFPNAIAALERAAEQKPDDVNVFRELGYAYEITKNYSRALDAYLKGLKLLPNDADFKAAANRVRPFAK